MLELHPKYLQFEGTKAFVVLSYAEFLQIEEKLQELEDIVALRTTKAEDVGAPTVSISEARERYALDNSTRQVEKAHELLALAPDLFQPLEDLARSTHKSVNEVVIEAVQQYLSTRWREQLEQEIAAYEAMHLDLWRTMPGMWVAVQNCMLVDQDRDKLALYRRIREQYGRVPVLIRRVKPEAKEEIWFRTPSTGKSSR